MDNEPLDYAPGPEFEGTDLAKLYAETTYRSPRALAAEAKAALLAETVDEAE